MGVDATFEFRPTEPIQEPFVTAIIKQIEGCERHIEVRVGRLVEGVTPWWGFTTYPRHYDIDYERGHWPDIKIIGDHIYDAIKDLGELRYGSDMISWDYMLPWVDVRDEIQAHWERVGNTPYDDSKRFPSR